MSSLHKTEEGKAIGLTYFKERGFTEETIRKFELGYTKELWDGLLNESVKKISGDNISNKERQDLVGNKNSGFSNNQVIIDFIDDLYSEYNVYDNYIKFFDKKDLHVYVQ